jgi:hypothetical protein
MLNMCVRTPTLVETMRVLAGMLAQQQEQQQYGVDVSASAMNARLSEHMPVDKRLCDSAHVADALLPSFA